VILIKNAGQVFCQISQLRRFQLVCLWQLIIIFPPAKYDFNNSVQFNAFASKAATNAVIVGTPVMILECFTDRTFRASISDFRKLIDAFHFFLATMGEGSSQVD